MKLIIFALIPLILSVGISPALPFSDAAESNQICIDKVWIENKKGKIACVTPSTADKLVERGWGTLLEDVSMDKPMKEDSMIGVESIETRIGTFTLEGNYLTVESDKTIKEELFFQRAVQVYLNAIPAIGGAGIFYGQDKLGATTGDVLYWSDFMTSETETLTGNISTLYLLSLQDLSDGPLIVEVPPGRILGHIDNVYQQVITDIGKKGPYEGEGGIFLILPPGFDGEIPDGYFVAQSDSMQIIVVARSFVGDTGKEAAVEQNKKINVYKLSEADNPPKVKMIDAIGTPLKLAHPTTDGFWEFLHEVYSKEPIVRPEDRNLIGLMHSIGIVPGESFEPDEHSKKLLDEAAEVGNLMMKSVAFNSPIKESWIYYPDKNWEVAFMTENPSFEDELGATQIDPRQSYVHQAITTSDAMVIKQIGTGSKYLMNYRDSNDDWLIGSNTYHIQIPANVPAENFWALTTYDAETRSTIVNDVQPLPGIRSLDADTLLQNDDGSYDAYFGPEAPEGYENNWVKTNEGDGFFVIFRFYAPTEAYFDKSWQLPMIEKIE